LARKILLADDSVTAQNMGRRILADAGYEVITVNNGSAALKKIAEQKPDLLILDVYMPGYGGLELCERLREARETARLPILLSVGKLEPFKADEARRVRADAYIVKPFEATELLTALTKLEDKIVPQPDANKSGRFAKSLGSKKSLAEETSTDESGWSDRLKIPSGPRLVDSDSAKHAGNGRRGKAGKEEPQTQAPGASATIPTDVTADELRALASAAASLQEPETTQQPASTPAEVNAATFPVTPDVTSEAATFASAPEVESAAETAASATMAEPEKVEASKPEAEVQATADSPQPQATASEHGSTSSPADADVMAALATLGGSDDAGKTAIPAIQQVGAAEVVTAAARGPRWTAEQIPVSEEEGTFILQHEMEKAHAAIAAAEGKTSFVTYAATEACSSATATSESTDAPAAVSETKVEPCAEPPTNIAEAASVSAAWGAPPAESSSEPSHAVEAQGSTAQMPENLAFGAAASAGTSTSIEMTSAAPAATVHDDGASQPDTSHNQIDSRSEADLAAAWANWKQIRETVVTSPDASVQSDAPVEHSRTTPDSSAQPEASSENSEAISTIVDNMLAELKPKLMEELAKKLAAEKKK